LTQHRPRIGRLCTRPRRGFLSAGYWGSPAVRSATSTLYDAAPVAVRLVPMTERTRGAGAVVRLTAGGLLRDANRPSVERGQGSITHRPENDECPFPICEKPFSSLPISTAWPSMVPEKVDCRDVPRKLSRKVQIPSSNELWEL
jgi:hypothetical protein